MRHIIIKMTLILLTGLLSAVAFAQVSVTIERLPLKEALEEVEKQSGYSFFYSSLLPDQDAKVSVKAKDATIEYVMDTILEGLNISYEIKPDFQIVLSEKTQEEKAKQAAKTSRQISGIVIDASGMPVIGAGVTIEGTKKGTVTDAEGRYSIEVASGNCTLEFSCLGYQTVRVDAGKRNTVDVTLNEDSQFLDEVVVVGYGTQKKVNLTGSVSMIDSEEISTRPISSVSSGLQGLLPGVTVTNPTGQPGESGTTIRVRGVGTIGNANPLILIDGVEGDLSAINPEDIESISVLKDAASASIYGSRAANGVLLVTTKKVDKASDSRALPFTGNVFLTVKVEHTHDLAFHFSTIVKFQRDDFSFFYFNVSFVSHNVPPCMIYKKLSSHLFPGILPTSTIPQVSNGFQLKYSKIAFAFCSEIPGTSISFSRLAFFMSSTV